MISNETELNIKFNDWYKCDVISRNDFYNNGMPRYHKNYHLYQLLKISTSDLYVEVIPFICARLSEFNDLYKLEYINARKKEKFRYSQMLSEEIFNNFCKSNLDMKLNYSYNEMINEEIQNYIAVGYPEASEEFIIIKMLYNRYIERNHGRFDKINSNILEDEFIAKGINLHTNDSQYNKYQLLSITDDYSIGDTVQNHCCLYHNKLSSFIFFDEISTSFFNLLLELKRKNHITDLALRPDYHRANCRVGGGRLLLEHKEQGTYFNFSALGKFSITKLYDKQYDNQLWIKIKDKEITFEELRRDFIEYVDFVVTQVVHVKYSKSGEQYYINHLDHEFIFYTFDEFGKRQMDPEIKGSAKKRFKTFKIDNSQILINEDPTNNLLFITLNEYFDNIGLIHEYFCGL